MRRSLLKLAICDGLPTGSRHANTRVITLLLVLCLLGLGITAFWLYRSTQQPSTAAVDKTGELQLSDSTKSVLKSLKPPVEVRFFSILDKKTVPETTYAFAQRVGDLLDEFKREAEGKLTVTRFMSATEAAMNSAGAAGIRPFNLEKGTPCFLGLVVVQKDQSETLPPLTPEWEAALEFDLARAIGRVQSAKSSASPPSLAVAPDPAVTEEVRRAIPDLTGVSLERGKELLRDAALQEFKAAAAEFQAQVQDARQRLTLAQQSQSETEQQAALKQLQQVQVEQTERLKNISARLQDRIETFERLKSQ